MTTWPAPTLPPIYQTDTPALPRRPIEVGDVFQCSWGYDQTNIDWYRVLAVTPKTIKVQQWSSILVDDNGPQTKVVPGDGPRTWGPFTDGSTKVAEIMTKRPRWSGGSYPTWCFKVASYADAYLWTPADGPASETGLGWGH